MTVADVEAPRSIPDRVVRRLMRVHRTDPKALGALQGSLLISGIRCIITYALVPLLTPVIGLADVLAAPLSMALSATAMVLSVISLRRVWIADHRLRWAYSAFILVVLVLLAITVVADVRTLA